MLELITSQASSGNLLPWSFLFATALVASALDAFTRRLFNPVVLTTWFFGLTVCASMGAWSIPELTAGAICLVTPHLLICSVSARLSASRITAGSTTVPRVQPAAEQGGPPAFEFRRPKPVAKAAGRASRRAA